MVRCGAAGYPACKNGNVTQQSTQRNVRDPSVYLFVNEGDETGNLVFGLCFPMASLDVDGPHLETGESENGGGQAGHREGQGCGELGAACYRWIGQLDRLAGYHVRHALPLR